MRYSPVNSGPVTRTHSMSTHSTQPTHRTIGPRLTRFLNTHQERQQHITQMPIQAVAHETKDYIALLVVNDPRRRVLRNIVGIGRNGSEWARRQVARQCAQRMGNLQRQTRLVSIAKQCGRPRLRTSIFGSCCHGCASSNAAASFFSFSGLRERRTSVSAPTHSVAGTTSDVVVDAKLCRVHGVSQPERRNQSVTAYSSCVAPLVTPSASHSLVRRSLFHS